MSKIIVSIATIPEREEMLKRTVYSLVEQCDILQVQLNNYEDVPEWLEMDGVIAVLTDNNVGDGFKFYNVETYDNAYFFTCDDDLIYPANYVETMVEWIERLNRSCVVTHHGRTLKSGEIISYYRDVTFSIACLKRNPYNMLLEFAGTGVTAFHTDTIKLRFNMFKKPNMADVWFGLEAKTQGVPIIALEHDEDFLGYQNPKDTIFDRKCNNEQDIVDIINNFNGRK